MNIDKEIGKAVEAGDIERAKEIEGLGLSKETQKELWAQAKKSKYDLLHDLMLKDIIATSDGFYLMRGTGDIGYNISMGAPNLSPTVMGRMRDEIEALTPASRYEVMVKIATKFPGIAKKLNDLYIKYKRAKA